MIRSRFIFLLTLTFFIFVVVGCGGAPLAGAPPPEEPAAEEPFMSEPELTAPAEAPAEEPMEEGPAAEAPPEDEAPAEDEPPPADSAPYPTMISPTATPVFIIPVTGSDEPETPQPAIPEKRRITFEFPLEMRTGDSTRIRLTLEVDDQGNIVPTAVVEGNVVTGEVVEIPNLYETHNVIAEARLDMAGMEVQPSGTISEPLLQGQSVTFYWSVRPESAGDYEGTAWLHLRFVPRNGGEEMRIPLSVQFLKIEAKLFLGLVSGGTARGVGVVGSALGSILGFPFFDDFLRIIFKFWKQKRTTRK